MVRLDVGLEDGRDHGALRLGERDVLIDEVYVRVDDGELPDGLAAEQVGGTGAAVVQELAEVHGTSVEAELDKLSSDLLNRQP